MKHFILIIFLVYGVQSLAGFEVQNGGGGLQVNGQYVTFQTANVPIQSKELRISEIPGLAYLAKQVGALPLGPRVKAELLRNILPSLTRAYFKVDDARLSPETLNKITTEYSKMMNVDASQIVIFATTNRSTNATILYSQFFTLKESEQAAILLHEALWSYDQYMTYAKVVTTEMAAQEVFEDVTGDLNKKWHFYSSLLNALEEMGERVALAYNLNLFEIAKTSVADIFGAEALQCLALAQDDSPECRYMLIEKLGVATAINPDDHFVDALYGYATALPVRVRMVHYGEKVDWSHLYLTSLITNDRLKVFKITDAAGTVFGELIFSF